jgi:hypothetical protein
MTQPSPLETKLAMSINLTTAPVAELLELRLGIDKELAARKLRLTKELASLVSIRPTRTRRSDAGQPRRQLRLETVPLAAPAQPLDEEGEILP